MTKNHKYSAQIVLDADFPEVSPLTKNRSGGKTKQIVIGDNVWLESRVMVPKGVSIGDNTVVAAGSIVTKALPSNVVAGGIPAKGIRVMDVEV